MQFWARHLKNMIRQISLSEKTITLFAYQSTAKVINYVTSQVLLDQKAQLVVFVVLRKIVFIILKPFLFVIIVLYITCPAITAMMPKLPRSPVLFLALTIINLLINHQTSNHQTAHSWVFFIEILPNTFIDSYTIYSTPVFKPMPTVST